MKRQLFTYLGSYPADSRFPFKPAVALAPLDSHCILSKHKAIFCSNSPCNSLTNSVQHFPLSIEFPLGILRGPRNHGRRKRDRNVERNDIGAQHTVFGAVREPMNGFTIRTSVVDLRGTLRELRTYTARHALLSSLDRISSHGRLLPQFRHASGGFPASERGSLWCFYLFISLFLFLPPSSYVQWGDQPSLQMVPKAVLWLTPSGTRPIYSFTPNVRFPRTEPFFRLHLRSLFLPLL